MNTRQLSIKAGKAHDTTHFSKVHPVSQFVIDEVALTLNPELNAQRKDAILNDPTKVVQYACLWGDNLGFLTKPTFFSPPGHLDESFVIASFSDRIGETVPVKIPTEVFTSSFTTLVRKGDADLYQLAQHPVDPDTVQAPVPDLLQGDALQQARDARAPATLGRLNFNLVGDNNEDQPRVVALPCFLPLAPGQTFPTGTPVAGGTSLRGSFPLLEVWRRGIDYAKRVNGGWSVTAGGPVFDLDAFMIDAADNDPFTSLVIRDRIPPQPEQLAVLGPEAGLIREAIDRLSLDAWHTLGASTVPGAIPNPAGQGGIGGDELREILAATKADSKPTKEKEQDEAALEVELHYRLALAALPPPSSGSTAMVVPTLNPAFREILKKAKPIMAASSLRQLVVGQVERHRDVLEAKAVDKDVSFSSKVCTTAFANAIRSFHWLLEPVAHTPKGVALTQLNLLHFLTPDQGGVFFTKSTDAADAPLVMSHISDDKAQLEASKGSRMYTNGILETGRDVYLAIVNLRMILLLMVEDKAHNPVVLQFLLEFVTILHAPEGVAYLRHHRNDRRMAVHLFQDAQHVLYRFFAVAQSPQLRKTIAEGDPVHTTNFKPAMEAARAVIDRLRVVVGGNDMGAHATTPACFSWFLLRGSTPGPAPKQIQDKAKPRERTAPAKASEPEAKRPHLNQDEIDKRKASGLLLLDPTVGGPRLPPCPVLHKAEGSATPERLCMQFLTQGRFCSRRPCAYPHITSLNRLPEPRRQELIKFVKDTPGLCWAPGKAPPGAAT